MTFGYFEFILTTHRCLTIALFTSIKAKTSHFHVTLHIFLCQNKVNMPKYFNANKCVILVRFYYSLYLILQSCLSSQVLKIGSFSLCKAACSIAYDNVLFNHFQIYQDVKAVIKI